MQRLIFVNHRIYHIYNRGVDKRNIFLDEEDYLRAIHNLFEFNDVNPASNAYYRLLSLRQPKFYEVGLRKIGVNVNEPRKLLVKILAFCLMPNHFHLLVEQVRDRGVTEFMRKFGTGYTNYFNQRYERSGVLFQGKFKAVLLERDEHFLHLPFYIHFNPLDINFSEWRERILSDASRALNFLKSYRWSSYLDYTGVKNFPSVTQRDFLENFYKGMNFENEMINWLKNLNLENIKDVLLE